VRGKASRVREWALSGVWGREVHMIDGDTKYARAPSSDNAPLSMWSNRWSTMPVHGSDVKLPLPDDRAVLDRMPGSRVPVIRQPFQQGDLLPFWAYGKFSGNHLYDLRNDPHEDENRRGEPAEADAADKLRQALLAIEAPGDQLARLGLT
jgi:hypothetical protein